MSIKIQFLILILATVTVKKSTACHLIVFSNDHANSSETQDISVKNIILGDNATLYCTFKTDDRDSHPRNYTWLKNNEPLQESETIKIVQNGQGVELHNISSNTEGNYTCKYEDADSKPITYQISARVLTEENRISCYEQDFREIKLFINTHIKHTEGFKNIIKKTGSSGSDANFDLFHIERQDFKTEVQKTIVEVGIFGRILVVSCSDRYELWGNKYNWLKNNKPLDSTEARMIDGRLLIGPLTGEQDGNNYTCVCKDTSCAPYNHTYEVKLQCTEQDGLFKSIIMKKIKPMEMMFISIFDPNYSLFQFERIDSKTEEQTITVDVGKYGRYLSLSCSDPCHFDSQKYTWLKNNISLESNTDGMEALRDYLIIGPVAEKHVGNYTCKCKDTSCSPVMHTFKVEVVNNQNASIGGIRFPPMFNPYTNYHFGSQDTAKENEE